MITLRWPPRDEYVFHSGATFEVEWYYTAAGELPGRDYYLALDGFEQARPLQG